jgi:hypothetical protein
MKRLVSNFCLAASIVVIISCSNFRMTEGEAEVVSVSDSTLNGSSIFVGYVYNQGYGPPHPVQDAQLWIENTTLNMTPGTAGYYHIKTVQGTYTIKCERYFNEWPELIEEVKNVTVNKNEKIHINFYLGYVDQ